MNNEKRQNLLATIDRLANQQPRQNPRDAENMLMSVLGPLLGEDGYDVTQTSMTRDGGIDFFAARQASGKHEACKIGIQFKYHSPDRPVSLDYVSKFLVAAIVEKIDRVIFIASSPFTRAVHDITRRELPVQIELVDLDALRAWVARLSVEDEELVGEVHRILKVVSMQFASLIARDPQVLAELEWRDIERTIAEVFEGIGFKVELTPSSKDGGKDVILECTVHGARQVYFVEIKHWRSNARVGGGAVRDFINVIMREKTEGGLFLSTYGYCDNAFEQISEIDRQRVRFGQEEKVIALCRTYVKSKSGIWSPPERLPEILYEGTI